MKRFVIALSIIILLAIFASCSPILAQPTHIPHQNPAKAQASPGLASLLLFYGTISELTATRQYQDAQTLLEEVKQASIPAELRGIIDPYNTLSRQLVTTLNNLEALLDETSTLFSNDQFSDARQRLNATKTAINSAQFLLEDTEAATNTLGDRFGVFAASSGSQIRQAYERQTQNLHRVAQLINELDQLRERLVLDPLAAISTEFHHPTVLEVSAPKTVYPGVPFTISGRVSSTGGEVDRTVKVTLDNDQLAEEITKNDFSLQITVPPQISTGKHSLTVVATPQGRYAGASKSLSINISVIPIRAEIQVPLLTVIPKTIRISGNVYHGLTPVEDARVTLVFKEATSTIRTSTDGSFTTTIEAPFDLSLIGPQELTTIIEPVESWYASPEIKRRIFIINPAIGVIALAFISLGLLVFSRVRTRPPSPREEMVIPQAELPELPGVTPPEPKYKFTGIKGKILSAYLSGLEAVEEVAGIALAPYTTLREFVNAASPRLPGAIKPFTELTTIAENALYSSHKLDENTAANAELLAGITKEELHNGAA